MVDDHDALREEALRAVLLSMRAADAKPETRLRAAETLLRMLPDAPIAGRVSAQALSSDALLAIAKGEGGTPPKGGPSDSGSSAVPSASREPPEHNTEAGGGPASSTGLCTEPEARQAITEREADTPDVSRGTREGTQRGPVESRPTGGPTGSFSETVRRGPKKDPRKGKKESPIASQIKIDDTPAAPRELEPWE